MSMLANSISYYSFPPIIFLVVGVPEPIPADSGREAKQYETQTYIDPAASPQYVAPLRGTCQGLVAPR